MRGAAMSLTAAASGFVVFLLSVSAVQGQNDWGVTYTSTKICVIKGSTVDIHCSYRYPSRINNVDTAVDKTLWFTKGSNDAPVDLRTDSDYASRVQYHCDKNDCIMRITDLRESDSAEYKFRFTTNQPGGKYTASPGVTLTVTDPDLQVKVIPSTINPSSAELKCHTSCRLPDRSSFIWYKNGQKITRQTSSSYSTNFNHTDNYTCAVTGYEDFPSRSVLVQDQNDWGVTYTSTYICALKGSTVDINCTYRYPSRINDRDTAVNKTLWFTEWSYELNAAVDLKTASEYAGRVQHHCDKNDCTLRITDLRERDSAEYKFRFITNQPEGKYIGVPGVTLTVSVPDLQVKVIPSTINPSSAELKCHSSCHLPDHSSFIWYKNGQKISGETSSSYSSNFNDADSYSCAVTGHEDFPSPTVYAPKLPSVSVSPSGEIIEGSSVNLTCSSDANPAAKYTWYKKNVNPDLQPLSKEPQLVFSSIQSSDSGEYYCTANNQPWRRASEYIFIDVKYAPKLPSVSVSPSAEIVEGSSVNLTCSSDANPAANYTWYKENQTLLQGPEYIYNFISISSEDSGSYHCKSENQYGQINSSSLVLDVQYAPRLPSVSLSPSAEIVEGSSVNLTCSSDANPAANYTWYKENEDSPIASGQIFTIIHFRSEHSGNYYCEAQNRRGRHNSTIYLTLVGGANISAAIGTIAVFLLAIIIVVAFLWIRRKRTQQYELGGSTDNRPQLGMCPVNDSSSAATQRETAGEQDDLHYGSVCFSQNQPDSLYSNITAAKSPRTAREEEDAVEYSSVKFDSASANIFTAI